MKKSQVIDEIDDFFDGNDLEYMIAMFDLMKMQNNCALELTKLVLEKCNDIKFTKDNIFAIFNEATETVAMSIKNNSVAPEV